MSSFLSGKTRPLCGSAGFTLIEVMVALMIVGIALPALMFQIGTQLDNTGVINNRTRAAWVAQDQLALLQLRQAAGESLSAGEWRGEVENAGRRWYWLRVAEPTPAPGLLRHSIRVADSEQAVLSSGSAQFSLDAYLMTPLAPANHSAGVTP